VIKVTTTLFYSLILSSSLAQVNLNKAIEQIQIDKYFNEICLDFVRKIDLPEIGDKDFQQIIIIRHGEPAMNKKGWKNRQEAIRYTEMYDSVGIYDFEQKPICLRDQDVDTIFTSQLPRAINTCEKTFENNIPMHSMKLFNEFERKVIKFPNIKLPRQFWSITTRIVWMMGFNHKGIESFSEAKMRANDAANYLDNNAQNHGSTVLFAHGFINRYIKKYLKKSGYKVIDMDGKKYLGAYYFYKIK